MFYMFSKENILVSISIVILRYTIIDLPYKYG